jgi:hypothetical protein
MKKKEVLKNIDKYFAETDSEKILESLEEYGYMFEDIDINKKIIDELYSYYEAEISHQNCVYIHPMFYNGTFSENNECQPTKPDELMSKDEFIAKMNSEPEEYRWNTAFYVLYCHISKENKK